MKKAILATKVGMTQIWDDQGVLIPVTVLQAGPCVVTQVKTVENDGYSAVQVGFGDIREKLVNKPRKGQFDKAGVSVKRYIKEFRLENAENTVSPEDRWAMVPSSTVIRAQTVPALHLPEYFLARACLLTWVMYRLQPRTLPLLRLMLRRTSSL